MDPEQTAAPNLNGSADPTAGATPETPPASEQLAENPFDDLTASFSSDDKPVEQSEEAPPAPVVTEAKPQEPTPAQPPAAPSAPVVAAPVEQPKPTEPVQAPVAPAVAQPPVIPQTTPQPQTAPAPAAQPEVTDEVLVGLRKAAVEQLEQTYRLSPEDTTAFLVEPDKVVPKLMAEAHTRIFETVMKSVVDQLPNVVRMLSERDKAVTKARGDFFSRWPQLEPFEQELVPLLQTYRAQNPAASAQTTIEQVGAMMMYMKGIAPTDVIPPAAPPRPFQPAAPGAAPAAMTPPSRTPPNPFAQMADQFRQEDM